MPLAPFAYPHMGWILAPDVSFCIASDKAIFLNTRADRYARLPDKLNEPFVAWVRGEHASIASDATELLHRTGFLLPSEAPDRLEPAKVIAATTHLDASQSGRMARLRSGAQFQLDLALAKRSVARRGLFHVLTQISGRRVKWDMCGDPRPDAAELLVAGAMLGPGTDCLPRSLALVRGLHRRGKDAQLVLGVLANPFRAHCWVQSEGCILNDHLDRVSIFTPIFAL